MKRNRAGQTAGAGSEVSSGAGVCARSVVVVAMALAFGGCEGGDIPVMGGVSGRAPVVPPVTGYAAGEEILFIHPEASDPEVAELLTEMMGSPVLVVPELAEVPEGARANVYVFTNGVEPDDARGPFGYQPDVFDCPPGEACYSPLRSVVLVAWTDPETVEVLRSAEAVERALAAGRLSAERPGAVVNMPFLTWPGGQR